MTGERGELVILDEYRPHVQIQTGNDVHVLPVKALQEVAEGKRNPYDIEDWPRIMRKIVEEWLFYVELSSS